MKQPSRQNTASIQQIVATLAVLSPPLTMDGGEPERIEAMKSTSGMTVPINGRVTGTLTTLVMTTRSCVYRIDARIDATPPDDAEDFDPDLREALLGHLKLQSRRAAREHQLPEPRYGRTRAS